MHLLSGSRLVLTAAALTISLVCLVAAYLLLRTGDGDTTDAESVPNDNSGVVGEWRICVRDESGDLGHTALRSAVEEAVKDAQNQGDIRLDSVRIVVESPCPFGAPATPSGEIMTLSKPEYSTSIYLLSEGDKRRLFPESTREVEIGKLVVEYEEPPVPRLEGPALYLLSSPAPPELGALVGALESLCEGDNRCPTRLKAVPDPACDPENSKRPSYCDG